MNKLFTAVLKKALALALFHFISFHYAIAQTSTLPIKGWAKNSVNAVVFRKNSVVAHMGHQYTAFYNGDGFVVLGKRKIGTTVWETKVTVFKGNVADAHNSISIIVDGAGFLHMSWDHHGSQLSYCKSVASGSLVLSAKAPMTGAQEGNVSYPEFHRLASGDLIFMYRDGSSGNGNLVINHYSTSQMKWTRVHSNLISGESLRNAYWQSHVDAKGIIHLSWVWRESSDVASNHDICYARSSDNGKTWKKSDGSTYKIPITAATAEYAVRIPQKSELINQTSMFGDDLGRPYICSYWKPAGTTVPQYHVVYHNGAKWSTVQASARKTAFSLSGSGTQKIPIARPQILVDNLLGKTHAYIVYRDVEQGDKVSLLYTKDLALNKWANLNLTNYTTGSWEPSYDTELWRTNKMLHIFVQRVGQGNGETLENLEPQNVTILQWDPVSIITGLNADSEKQDLEMACFPNPFNTVLSLTGEGDFQYSIFNTSSQLVEKGQGANSVLAGESLSQGIYFVYVQNKDKSKVFKVYKK